MALVLGVSAIANDCCDIKNNAKCDCTTEKKSENCHYDKEKTVDCDCEVQNTQNNTNIAKKSYKPAFLQVIKIQNDAKRHFHKFTNVNYKWH